MTRIVRVTPSVKYLAQKLQDALLCINYLTTSPAITEIRSERVAQFVDGER